MTANSTFQPLSRYTIIEILDRTYRIYRNNFLPFVGLAALVMIPITIVNTLVTQSYETSRTASLFSYQDPDYGSTLGYLCIIGIILPVLQTVLLNGLLTYAASENHLGRKLSIEAIAGEGGGRLGRLALGLFLFYLLLGAGGFVLYLLLGILRTIGLILFIPGLALLVYAAICINAFLAPVLILEDVSAGSGLNRAFGLAKARFWSVFGLMIAIWLITFIISVAFATFLAWVMPQSGYQDGYTWADVLETVVTTIINIFLAPVLPVGLTLMYYDTRVRLEGLDIALEALDMPNPRPYDLTSPPARSGLVGRDWLNMVILVGGVIVIYLLFAGAIAAYLGFSGIY
ncbi:MAG: hypothetical protein JXB47_20495 [Anaerolineae bacterium]|nr:hypothetical protein [Anaerolineae bacterium]